MLINTDVGNIIVMTYTAARGEFEQDLILSPKTETPN